MYGFFDFDEHFTVAWLKFACVGWSGVGGVCEVLWPVCWLCFFEELLEFLEGYDFFYQFGLFE